MRASDNIYNQRDKINNETDIDKIEDFILEGLRKIEKELSCLLITADEGNPSLKNKIKELNAKITEIFNATQSLRSKIYNTPHDLKRLLSEYMSIKNSSNILYCNLLSGLDSPELYKEELYKKNKELKLDIKALCFELTKQENLSLFENSGLISLVENLMKCKIALEPVELEKCFTIIYELNNLFNVIKEVSLLQQTVTNDLELQNGLKLQNKSSEELIQNRYSFCLDHMDMILKTKKVNKIALLLSQKKVDQEQLNNVLKFENLISKLSSLLVSTHYHHVNMLNSITSSSTTWSSTSSSATSSSSSSDEGEFDATVNQSQILRK